MLNWVEHEKKFYNLGPCFQFQNRLDLPLLKILQKHVPMLLTGDDFVSCYPFMLLKCMAPSLCKEDNFSRIVCIFPVAEAFAFRFISSSWDSW